MMKKLVSFVVLVSALALSACGGSSDSSGRHSLMGSSKTCKASADGKVVSATVQGCDYSVSGFNKGKRQTYTCVNAYGRVETEGKSGKPLVIKGVTFECVA